ncbi:ABC transporter ATP-binding protein [Corallococcus exercitus]|uniref:peptidase domain-containing ABC transporter n=1 Tax=Corallococcus exercitus TaxID=2316736 RepID=UPI000EA0BA85|nr:ABC transporter ATP-binding protein [Corallococcus exercitus]RKG78634.1 ABC transporter ATP-binding protein [Corallococcus exercitus]
MTPWERLKAVLAPERGDLWVLVVYGAGVGLLSLAVPITAQAVVNTAAFGTVLQPVAVLGLVVFFLLVLAGGLRVMQVLVAERLQQRLFARMAVDLAWRLPRVQERTHDTYRVPELVNRFMDVMTIQKATSIILLDGLALALQALVGLVVLAFYSPLLLGFDVLLLGSMALVLFGLGRGAVRTSVQESYRKYEVVGWLTELARVPLAFWGPAGGALALRRADEATQAYLEARSGHFRILLRQVVGTLAVQALASGLLLGVGGWLVTRQQLSLGQLVAAELIVAPVVASFAKFGKYLESFYDLLAAVDKVGHLFDLPLRPEAGEPLDRRDGRAAALRLRDVSLLPTSLSTATLRGVDLTVEPGSRVAIVGPYSSGKRQLMDVALGLREPARGFVELDGMDLREVSRDSLQAQVALVRGIQLFDGTVQENVSLGREDVSLHDVRQALDAVCLLEELVRLPDGLRTRLTGGHTLLSPGQAQRLMLARALVGRPRLLVLDEALDSLDADVRAQVVDRLLAPGTPWTLVLTTHLPELAARCDRALRVEAGTLMEVERS